METTNLSIADSAIASLGRNAWIARTAKDLDQDVAAVTHALRNVTCAAIRASVAALPTDGAAVKAPTSRTGAIAALCAAVRHIRAYGYVETATFTQEGA